VPVDDPTLSSIMARAVAAEDVRLEERAVLHAIQTAGRFTSPLPAPRALPSTRVSDSQAPASTTPSDIEPAGPRLVGAPGSPARTFRLGVIEGAARRPDSPTLA
jgi:hypothetical protein